MLRVVKIVGAVLIVASMATGCALFTTKNEGREMRRKLAEMDGRLARMEASIEREREFLTEMIDRARTEVDKLEDTLNRATRILARNSADYGAEIDSLKQKLREADGTLAELRYDISETGKLLEAMDRRINGFAVAAGLDIPVDESKVPKKAGEHFAMIKQSYQAGRWGEARSLGKLFIARHPEHQDADDVQLILGKSYIDQKRWAKALGELREFVEKYPKSKLAAEVFYGMARSFFALGHCTDARILIEAITTRHKKSPFSEKASNLAVEIKKNKSRCTS
ncbi:MAG: tetratricopeptide repeat protein [Proteobacteria bacterium]|nr:tetratricopeptide repeat protein [Pseudomonadota bacterium]